MTAPDVDPPESERLVRPAGRPGRRRQFDRVVGWLLPLLFLPVLFPIVDLFYWVGSRALPTLTWTVLTTNPTGASGGLFGPLVGSLEILGLSTGIAATIGIASAIVIAEYASPRVQELARLGTNLLAGVPSIVIGYFGYFVLVFYFGWGASLLAGAVTLAIFVLPYVMRSADLALSSVPSSLREAALGAGASRGQYLGRVGLFVALPGILNGVFLSMAIGLGETAPLLYTAFFSNYPPTGLLQPTGYLTGLIWNYYDQPTTFGTEVTLAFQAAFLLMVIVIALNVVIRLVGEWHARRVRGMYL